MSHRKQRPPRVRLGLSLLAVMALAAGCGSGTSDTTSSAKTSAGTSTASAGKAQKVTIGVSVPIATFFLPYMAKETNAFAKYGIDADVKIVPSGQILASLASGTIQFGITSAPQFEVGAQKAPIKVIAQWAPHLNAQFVGGPGVDSPKELAGKRVTEGAPGSASAVLATQVLNQAGVDPKAIKLVPLPSISQVIPLFLKGRLDATVVAPPLTGVLLARKGAKVLTDFKGQDFTGALIAGNVPWMTAHRDATANLLRGLNAGLDAWWKQPDVAQRIIATQAKITDPKLAKGAYEGTLAVFTKTLEPESAELAKTVLETARANGVAQADPAKASVVGDSSYLDAALKQG
jgi:ABC-type nitrate/sulfonate/bicarbonate transport system substrate-binding protein